MDSYGYHARPYGRGLLLSGRFDAIAGVDSGGLPGTALALLLTIAQLMVTSAKRRTASHR